MRETEPRQYSVVDGVWSTDCMARDTVFDSYRIELTFSDARNVVRMERYFADSACSQIQAELQYDGRYELMVTSRDFIYGIDLYYEQQTLAALQIEGQQYLEQLAIPVPLKNLNLVQIDQGHSLDFGGELAHENERPIDIAADSPQLIFLAQPSPETAL